MTGGQLLNENTITSTDPVNGPDSRGLNEERCTHERGGLTPARRSAVMLIHTNATFTVELGKKGSRSPPALGL